jgi:two-component system LytT family response regulator
MPVLRTLLVDDEPLARERLSGLLGREPDVEVIGECATGAAALAAIEALAPDLVFLDMELPGGDGLEVISRLPADRRPAIVVATAHAEFAVKAFAAAAVDYLLKPFDADRLRSALQRSREYLQARTSPPPRPVLNSGGRLTVRTEGRIVFLRPDEIVRVEADNNHVVIHQASGALRFRGTLAALEERLAPDRFVRVNRSNLVALDQIKEMVTAVTGGVLVLRDGTRLPCSRELRGQFSRLGEK